MMFNSRLHNHPRIDTRLHYISLLLTREGLLLLLFGEGVGDLNEQGGAQHQTKSIGFEYPALGDVVLPGSLHYHCTQGVGVAHLGEVGWRSLHKASLGNPHELGRRNPHLQLVSCRSESSNKSLV